MTGETPRPIHVIPIGDEREHAVSSWCWCLPDRDVDPDAAEGDPPVYVHNSVDMREEFERQTGESYKGRLWGCFFED